MAGDIRTRTARRDVKAMDKTVTGIDAAISLPQAVHKVVIRTERGKLLR